MDPNNPQSNIPDPNAANPANTNSPDQSLQEILAMEPTDKPVIDEEKVSKILTNGETQKDFSEKETKRIRWRCRNCQYQYEGYKKLTECPRCKKDPSFFEDVD